MSTHSVLIFGSGIGITNHTETSEFCWSLLALRNLFCMALGIMRMYWQYGSACFGPITVSVDKLLDQCHFKIVIQLFFHGQYGLEIFVESSFHDGIKRREGFETVFHEECLITSMCLSKNFCATIIIFRIITFC